MLKKLLFTFCLFYQLSADAQSLRNCLILRESLYIFPLQAITGTNARKTFRYSFSVYNACKEPVRITRITGDHKDSFSINKVLPPQQETPLLFEGTVYNNGEDFRYSIFWATLELSDKSTLTFHVQIPTIGGNSIVSLRPDSSVAYAITQKFNTRFNFATFTYPSGHIRATGRVLDADTTLKAGRWDFFAEGKWAMDTISYSKEMIMYPYNQLPNSVANDGNFFPFRVKTRAHNEWKEPVAEWRDNRLRFFYSPATDSIVAYTDTSAYGFAIQYDQMPPTINIPFYLLKPGEPVMKVGPYLTPFAVVNDVYVPVLHMAGTNILRREEAVRDSFFVALLKQYPRLSLVNVHKKQKGISTGALSNKEKSQLFQQLQASPMVSYLCQLFTIGDQHAQGYCNNMVYVTLKENKLEEFKQAASALGFGDLRADGYSSNTYFVTYKSRWVNEEFFHAFQQLTAHPLVAHAYFNTYGSAEPEEGLMRKQ